MNLVDFGDKFFFYLRLLITVMIFFFLFFSAFGSLNSQTWFFTILYSKSLTTDLEDRSGD